MSILIKGMEMPKHCGYCRFRYDGICHALQKTQYAVTDCPLQPLVRCENCKYCHKDDESEYWCYGFCSPARLVRKDDFCSYGCKTE